MVARTPLPALLYQPLPAGPGWVRTYEIQPNIPIDGSKGILRDPVYGSPFTFSIIPPPALMDALSNLEQRQPIDIMTAALRTNNDFSLFTKKIEEFRSSSFATKSNAQQSRQANLIGNNGVFYNPATGEKSQANVLGVADVAQAMSVIAQLNAMVTTPPLTLLVNPQSLTVTRQKKQQYQDRTRNGYVFQAWGEEQVRLSVSGRTGAYYAGTRPFDDVPQNFQGLGGRAQGAVGQTSVVSGMQFASKRDSASWQNLMSLLTLYRNNGYIYDLIGESEAHWWIGMIAISYDQWTYTGHFDRFSFSYDETNGQHSITFDFDFTASFVFDNAQRDLQVLPIRSPTPSPSDPLWSSGNKRAVSAGTLRGRLQGQPRALPPQTTITDPNRAAILRTR